MRLRGSTTALGEDHLRPLHGRQRHVVEELVDGRLCRPLDCLKTTAIQTITEVVGKLHTVLE